MRKVCLLLAAVVLACPAWAGDLTADSKFSVTASDTGALWNDTTYTRALNLKELGPGVIYLYWGVDVRKRDLAFGNDSLKVLLEYSVDGTSWTIFDSLMIDFNTSGNDTTVNDATRMKLDSTVTHCNLIRGHMIRSHTISGTGADTTVGNTYWQEQRLWLFPRY